LVPTKRYDVLFDIRSAEGPIRLIVETHLLTKRYATGTALADCSLGVERGEVFGLLGPNGAGKTTLLRLLLGFLRPTAGWARIAGLDCQRQSLDVRRQVAYLPAEAAIFPQMRGSEALKFFAEVRGDGGVKRAMDIARRLELDASRRVSFMSTGMKHKLALAATMSAAVPIFILDEPTANLDPTVRATVLDLVKEAKAAGKTAIFSSHILSEVEEVCDRVVILRSGRLVHTQMLAELRQQHRIIAQLKEPLPAIPEHLRGQLAVVSNGGGQAVLETDGELSSLLSWLATLPLADMRIEPVGLRTIYDRYHRELQGAVGTAQPTVQ
jgi:ABC-2 type transport system ATP-binding protein